MSEANTQRQYAPGWRSPGVPVNARLRRSERGFKKGERVVGVWDRYKGDPGAWVVSRRPDDARFVFLVAAVALADVQRAERADVDPELLREKGGRVKATHAERAELARENGQKGGRPRLEADEVREVYAVRLPAWVIAELKTEADRRRALDPSDPHGKHARLAADALGQLAAKLRAQRERA